MNKEWGFGINGQICTDSELVETTYNLEQYLMIHLPSKAAFIRQHYFVTRATFQFCIDKWNEAMPSEWLHIPLEDIEGWDYKWKDDKEAAQWLRKGYDSRANAYRNVARKLNLLPWQVQAVTWEVFRNGT